MVLSASQFPAAEVIEIRRRFEASCEALFLAWTDPEALKAWFGPEGVETRKAEVDLRVGGQYRVEMHLPSGSIVEHSGVYLEIIPPTRLVFSWIFQGEDCHGAQTEIIETRVTINLSALDDGRTELYLLHEGLPTQKARNAHRYGWNGCLDGLHQYYINE